LGIGVIAVLVARLTPYVEASDKVVVVSLTEVRSYCRALFVGILRPHVYRQGGGYRIRAVHDFEEEQVLDKTTEFEEVKAKKLPLERAE
jgi:hypothetical protein